MTTAPKLEPLLPCPFCGGAPDIEPWHGGGPNKQMIKCWGDDCEVAPMVSGESPKEAIANWNRRAAPSAGLREAMTDAIALVLRDAVPDWNDAQVAADCANAALLTLSKEIGEVASHHQTIARDE